MTQTKTQILEWHVGARTSFLHSSKNISKTLLICLPNLFPSSLQFFKQFAVSEQGADFVKFPNCQYHLLIHDESIDLSSFKIDRNCYFSYQSADCLFTTFKYYFPCITQITGFVFQKLSSAIDFHRSLKFPVLTNLSFTKKTTPTQEIQNKTFSKKSVLSLSGTDQRHDLFFKIGSIPKSEKRQQFLQSVHDLSSALQ